MKKFLLFVAVAMTAMVANAQKATRSLSLSDQLKAVYSVENSMSVAVKNNAKKFGVAKKDASVIEFVSAEPDAAGPDGDETEFISTSSVTIYPKGTKTTYKGESLNEATTPLGNRAGCDWNALYNDDMTKIIIPVNQEYTDPEYGLIYMWGLIEKEDGIYYDDENDIIFNMDAESGMYECENVGWAMKMTGQYEQYVWTSSWYPTWMIPNGVETGSYAGSGSWADYSNPIFVEDLGDEVNIYNFFGMTMLNILFDEETGNLLIPMGQPVTTTSSNVDKDVYGYFINVVGTRLEDRSIYRDYDKEYTDAYFAVIDEEQHALVSAANNILTDPNNGYMSLASLPDSEGAAYGAGWLHAINFTLNEGEYKNASTAIKNVNAASAKSDNKVFSISGQQVTKDFKGIVIRDGKKFLQK